MHLWTFDLFRGPCLVRHQRRVGVRFVSLKAASGLGLLWWSLSWLLFPSLALADQNAASSSADGTSARPEPSSEASTTTPPQATAEPAHDEGTSSGSAPTEAAASPAAVVPSPSGTAESDPSAPESTVTADIAQPAKSGAIISKGPLTQAQQVELLLEGQLPVEIDPTKLLGIAATDEARIAEELSRLKKELKLRVTELGRLAAASSGKPGKRGAGVPDQNSDPLSSDAQTHLLALKIQFLSLPAEERSRLLADHARRQAEANPSAESREAEKRAQLAEQERQEALEAARRARTEAERLVAEETARLLQVRRKQAEFDVLLAGRRADLLVLEERYLSLQRRARGALNGADHASLATLVALHKESERLARETQKSFSLAVRSPPMRAPQAGEDKLLSSGLSLDISEVGKLRQLLAADAERLNRYAIDIRWQRRSQLYHILRGANQLRLALFDVLPADQKDAELGLNPVGIDHAGFELRQVALIMRYHVQVTTQWLEQVRTVRKAAGASTIMTGAVFAQLLAIFWLFLWTRKRLPLLIEATRAKDLEAGGHSRLDPIRASTRALTILADTHRPLLFLAFLWAVHHRLPDTAQNQVEVSLFYRAIIWLTSANLIIQLINSLAGGQLRSFHRSLAAVRLRSLRLVGRTGAYIGLLLSITAQLVGRGTIYHWVIQLTWALVIPTILLLCHWWRPLVHAYIEAERRKSAFREWVLGHKTGIVGLLGAGLAGLDLIRVSTVRALRVWADEFVVTRRVAAYLFQRELDRRAVEEAAVDLQPLSPELFDKLSPELPSPQLSTTSSEDVCKSILARTKRGRGGVFAIVGERGSGKSTHTRRLADTTRALLIQGEDNLAGMARAFCKALGSPPGATLKECIKRISEQDEFDLVIIEGAHGLIRPGIGGIAAFDQLIGLITPASEKIGWVLTFQDSIWNFFQGARGVQPTFDEAVHLKGWSESEIRDLLEARSRVAGIRPNFQLLVSSLPADADAIDRLEALEKAKKSFYRFIWDYAAGNPGVALAIWRRSLAVAGSGEVYVQLFQAPRAEELEDLPDPAAFVLRAIVQLGDASLEEITHLTRLNTRLIQDTIRYGQGIGMLAPSTRGISVTWLWYRAVTRFLHRRHLLYIFNLKGAGAA